MSKVITGYSKPEYCLSNGTAKALCRGVSVSATIDTNEGVKFYADNGLAENTAPIWTGGTLSLVCDGLAEETALELYGRTGPTSPETWMAYNNDNVTPKVAIGFIVRSQENGTVYYTPVAFPRIQFNETALSAETQGETVSFQTTTLEGKIYADDEKCWKYVDQSYSTEAAALTALETKLAAIA